ncbi:HNH endonuclease [Succinivibrio sp.]|uniref:HNH endonuclease n=1 Tax=Succinivibrio sp. TaxID=2053619 RepID=UPI0025ECA69C|nr:HNH endonuclease domain-containing protein [Succinivibrio sp.]MBQ9220460.1 HNH endonuclease [Succinivibrio sp.]
MAAGWNLSEGSYDPRRILTEEDLNDIFSVLFSNQSKNTTSYKFGFLKAILDNLYNVDINLSLSFTSIFAKFAESYWNLVLVHKLKQCRGASQGKIYDILHEEWNNLPENNGRVENTNVIPFESLSAESQVKIISNVTKECSKYVVGATYADSKGNFYSFSKKSKTITFNPVVYQYLLRHKTMIEKVNYFEWAKFLHEVNESSGNDYLESLDYSTKRNNLDSYRKILFEEFEHRCFYCGAPLKDDRNTHVDHFIPWSFVKDDKLWNFVLACSKCNESKNNKLPPREKIDLIVNRNRILLDRRASDSLIDSNVYTDETIPYLYKVAAINGFNEVWLGK